FVDPGLAQLLVELLDGDASRLFLQLQGRHLGPDRLLLVLGAQARLLARAQLLGAIVPALARQRQCLLAPAAGVERRLQGLLGRLGRQAREALPRSGALLPAAFG